MIISRIIKNRSRQILTIPILAGMLLSGCKTMKPAVLPAPLKIPDTFPMSDEGTAVTSLSWKQFYGDEKLVSLIELALKNNQDINAGLQRILIARAQVMMARAAGLPSLNIVASAAVDKYGDYTMTGVGNFDTNLSPNVDDDQKVTNPAQDFFLGLRSNWELDIWGKLRSQRKAAGARFLASERAQRWFITQVVAQVADRYFELMALDNQLKIIDKNTLLQQRAVEITEGQMAGGRATALAVKQFRARLLNMQSAAIELKQQIIATENELNVLLGRFPQPITRSGSIINAALPGQLKTGIPTEALQRRPDIQQAELALAATRADVNAARKAFFPSLTLTPYAGYNAFKGPLLFSPGSLTYGLLGGLTGPIFNQYQLKSRFAVANADQAAAFYNYQKSIVQGYQEVHTLTQQIAHFKEAYAVKSTEVDTLTETIDVANELYQGGYINYLEVITAQRSVLESELEQVNLKRRLFQSSIYLYRALGGGWE
jgi:multidrug efflux system outer membrane protein